MTGTTAKATDLAAILEELADVDPDAANAIATLVVAWRDQAIAGDELRDACRRLEDGGSSIEALRRWARMRLLRTGGSGSV